MKLKNKETGEIIDIKDVLRGSDDYPNHYLIRDEWEDYEEPKEYWFIDYDGGIIPFSRMKETATDRMMKQIGNYFDSREKAEKAVEKLKALAEAKEDGLKIKGYYYNHEDLVILADIGKCNKLTLDTLFGKEID